MGITIGPITQRTAAINAVIVNLCILLLDKKKALISTAVYLLIGFVGIPVYSGFSAGAGKLFGPTGGYLIGYLVLSFLGGSFLENVKYQGKQKVWYQILALSIGTIGLFMGLSLKYQKDNCRSVLS